MIQELRYVGWEPGRYELGGDGAELAEIVSRASRAIKMHDEDALSHQLGCSRSTVWRCAASRQVTTATIERLCCEMGLSGDWLMLGKEAPPVRKANSRLGGLVRELGRRSAMEQEPVMELREQALA